MIHLNDLIHQDNVLILVPHPDDELIGCSAIIGRLKKLGKRIMLVFLSNGIPNFGQIRIGKLDAYNGSYSNYSAIRKKEFNSVMCKLDVKYFKLDYNSRELHLYMCEIYSSINKIICNNIVDSLLIPAYEGGHLDHDSTHAIGSKLGSSNDLAVYEYPLYRKNSNNDIEKSFINIGHESEYWIKLTEYELNNKEELLAIYSSQTHLFNLGKQEIEGIRLKPDYDYLNTVPWRYALYEDWIKQPSQSDVTYRIRSFIRK